jgi:hypothetical protein
MRRAKIVILLAALAVFALVVCGTTAGTGSVPAAPSAATEPSAEPAGAAANATSLCDFLAGEVPSLQSVGSPVGAQARFTGDYGTWIEGGPDRQLSSARPRRWSTRSSSIAVILALKPASERDRRQRPPLTLGPTRPRHRGQHQRVTELFELVEVLVAYSHTSMRR